jgi:glycyl-tRNA synthetase beta chain
MGLALDYLREEIPSFFKKNRIQASEPRVVGSPRRLVISFDEVDYQQEDVVETHFGPNVKLAYNEEGKPTKSAIGFARGKGIDPSQLTRKKTSKGEVVCARVEKIGQPTATILNDFFPNLIRNIPFPKKMRWGNRETPFVRPLQWIVALFGSKPLNFSYEGIHCNDISRGHRFLCPDFFKVLGINDYLKSCEKHFLLIDPIARKQSIVDQVTLLAKEVGGTVELDPDLASKVTWSTIDCFLAIGSIRRKCFSHDLR